MMKTVLFGLLLIGNVYTVCGMGSKEITIRPVTFTVFDAETKEPLEGIIVTVVNVTCYTKAQRFLWFGIDQLSDYTYYGYRYETNSEGIIEIPEFKYTVNRNEYLYSQRIIINLEAVDKERDINEQAITLDVMSSSYTAKYNEIIFRPQHEFKAMLILSRPEPMDWFYQLDKTKPYLTEMSNGHDISLFKQLKPRSFYCDHEEFTVYLERFIEPEDSLN